MSQFSRRKFIGIALGASSVAMLPGVAFTTARAEAKKTPKPKTETRSAMDRIKAAIAQWEKDGRQFRADALAADNDAQWDKLVRHYFDRDAFTSISVNAANLCPSMKPVSSMVELVQGLLAADISFPMRGELADASLVNGLGAVKDWFGLGQIKMPADFLLALTANSTEGNNFINNGLVTSGFFDPQKDNVVTWDVNHPTNYDAWFYRKATQGWGKDSVRVLQTKMFANTVTDAERAAGMIPSDPASEKEILEALRRMVDKNTKIVTLSWQSNECGMLLPMKRIVDELRTINKDIYIHADSAQTFGVLDLNLDKVGVDSIAGSFHKWPCGPKMVGILYMNTNTGAAEKFTPSIWGYDEHINTPADYGFPAESGKIDPNAKRFSYLGQQNDATLVSTWMAALFHTGHFHPGVTPARIEARIHALGDKVKQALFKHLPKVFPDFTAKTAYKWITTPTTNDALRSSVFLFKTPDGIGAGDVMKHVYEKHGFAIANLKVKGHDLVRVSPTFCNLSSDPEAVVAAVVDVIKAMQSKKLASNVHTRAYV
ncbi:aminotransferase class V [Solidesulfovibrio fructosivorans JJ]]|uniref:Aminotransferase class V n=1 Tax=Solidesulfovibrio fructosivorans JJ] TaxID=596151 RepID=E1K2H5_SOLFR|nr:aminotransferase class V-fold PLP-dependent enzyme [Solidesulfovibrio fructosivorans]EFL49193.1 aminotransferase class V [Solidesulfovibrio fructosivorans JJ]]